MCSLQRLSSTVFECVLPVSTTGETALAKRWQRKLVYHLERGIDCLEPSDVLVPADGAATGNALRAGFARVASVDSELLR